MLIINGRALNLTTGELTYLGETILLEAKVLAVFKALYASRGELVSQETLFAQVWGDDALVSTLPLALPHGHKLFPRATFDLRRALAIHAEGIARVVRSSKRVPRRCSVRAMIRLTAEGVSPNALAAADRLPSSATVANTTISPDLPLKSICAP